jgi:hypothetical protein
MRFPYTKSWPHDPFTRAQLDQWIDLYKPANIELDDRQYMHLAELMSFNPREYRGIPIVFLEALTT